MLRTTGWDGEQWWTLIIVMCLEATPRRMYLSLLWLTTVAVCNADEKRGVLKWNRRSFFNFSSRPWPFKYCAFFNPTTSWRICIEYVTAMADIMRTVTTDWIKDGLIVQPDSLFFSICSVYIYFTSRGIICKIFRGCHSEWRHKRPT